jgi:drug/metabolite transporter (DMT)-like permease
MDQRLTLSTAALLTLAPFLWAGNAVAGRIVAGEVPPMTLNFLRWTLAFLLLLPLAGWVLKRGSPFWPRWRRYVLLGVLGVGSYNSLQYLALKTSTPINVTLVAASAPMFMLALGTLFFGQRVTPRQVIGVVLSIAGVAIVLARGSFSQLSSVRFVAGDVYMLIATAGWAWYSWLLTRKESDAPEIRGDWAAFLMAQLVPGLAWSAALSGVEVALGSEPIAWSWRVALVLAYVAIGPAILAYRAWGAGVQRVGPNVAGFFSNLTPLFAALLSTALLGELPHAYHGVAFALIVGGIVVSSRR